MSWKRVLARHTSQIGDVAVQPAEDAGVVAADEEI